MGWRGLHMQFMHMRVELGSSLGISPQWLASESQGSACLCLLRAMITSTPFHASFFKRLLENQPRTSCLFNNALPTQPSLQFQNGTWFPYLPKPFVSNADTREKFLFLLHVLGYKSWSVGLLFGSLKGSIETSFLFFSLDSYFTCIGLTEPRF